MNLTVDLYEEEKKYYDKDLLTQIAKETISESDITLKDNVNINISVAIVSEEEIKRINAKLRGKDVITDVISVGEYSDDKDISVTDELDIFLGEVILCYNFIKQFALKNNVEIDKEFFTVYAHGILHLLGFEHGAQMFQIQDAISEKFCYNK